MKKTLLFSSIIAGSALVSSAAYAEGNNLADLFYKPATGDIVSTTSISDGEAEYTETSTKTQFEYTAISETISYGVNNKLSVDASISYINTTENVGTGADQDSDGLTNPEITLNYRVANQKQDGAFTDLRASYAPDIFDAKLADSTNDGDVARGGNTYGVGVSHGRAVGNITYKVNADVTVNEDYEVEDAGSATTKTAYDSSTDFSFGVDAQYRVNDQISVDAGASRTLVGDTSSHNSGTINQIDGGDYTTLSIAANYVVNPDVTVSVGYANADYDDVNVGSTKRTSVEADEVSLSVAYRF